MHSITPVSISKAIVITDPTSVATEQVAKFSGYAVEVHEIPPEAYVEIFKHFSTEDLLAARQTCTYWKAMVCYSIKNINFKHFFKHAPYVSENFIKSIDSNDTAKFDFFIDEIGADVNAYTRKNWSGCSALHIAACKNLDKLGIRLIEAGANVEARSLNGSTPIHAAAGCSSTILLIKMIEKGPYIEIRNFEYKTPLHCAAGGDTVESITELLKLGADIEAKDSHERTPLHVAAEYCKPQMIAALLKSGAEIKARDIFGRTPVHCAARNSGHDESIESLTILLDTGADIEATDKFGHTPLCHALTSGCGSTKAATYLMEAGADIDFIFKSTFEAYIRERLSMYFNDPIFMYRCRNARYKRTRNERNAHGM